MSHPTTRSGEKKRKYAKKNGKKKNGNIIKYGWGRPITDGFSIIVHHSKVFFL
jgi:hypothetical protein